MRGRRGDLLICFLAVSALGFIGFGIPTVRANVELLALRETSPCISPEEGCQPRLGPTCPAECETFDADTRIFGNCLPITVLFLLLGLVAGLYKSCFRGGGGQNLVVRPPMALSGLLTVGTPLDNAVELGSAVDWINDNKNLCRQVYQCERAETPAFSAALKRLLDTAKLLIPKGVLTRMSEADAVFQVLAEFFNDPIALGLPDREPLYVVTLTSGWVRLLGASTVAMAARYENHVHLDVFGLLDARGAPLAIHRLNVVGQEHCQALFDEFKGRFYPAWKLRFVPVSESVAVTFGLQRPLLADVHEGYGAV